VGGGCSDGKVDLPRRPHPGGFREGKPWKGQGTLLIRGIIEEGQWVGGKLTGKISHRNGSVVEVRNGVVGSGTQAVPLA
jgi:hypothetical protein